MKHQKQTLSMAIVTLFFACSFANAQAGTATVQSVTGSSARLIDATQQYKASSRESGDDHHNAVDVALHPDSSEGRALINYLQGRGIPFLAFRGAIPGIATGPHIHIGSPSHRLS
jgi:hypothetical protein